MLDSSFEKRERETAQETFTPQHGCSCLVFAEQKAKRESVFISGLKKDLEKLAPNDTSFVTCGDLLEVFNCLDSIDRAVLYYHESYDECRGAAYEDHPDLDISEHSDWKKINGKHHYQLFEELLAELSTRKIPYLILYTYPSTQLDTSEAVEKMDPSELRAHGKEVFKDFFERV